MTGTDTDATTETDTGAGYVDDLLIESAERLFSETCSFDTVQAAEAEGWAPDVWQAVAEAGFAWIGVAAEAGGSGGSLADACAVLQVAGANAAPIPLAETGILGGWLLAEAGITLADGPVTVVPGFADDTLSVSIASPGRCARSPTAGLSSRRWLAPGTFTAALPVPPPAWIARRRTTWGCSRRS